MSTDRGSGNPIGRYLITFFVLFGVWLALVGTFNWEELVIGAIIAAIGAGFGWRAFSRTGFSHLSVRKVVYLLAYIPVFLWEMIKANFDVAYRVIHPRMPIKPGIVMINTDLSSDTGKMVLANSITLTPGTLTMDIRGGNLLIHWINVKDAETEGATKLIGTKFEKFIRVIFS